MPLGRVLVVDDEPEVRDMLRDLLVQIGYLVETAARGAEALVSVDTFRPDVVLLDLNMPGLSGTDVLAHLRQRRPQLPIIIVTANEDVAVAEATLVAGAFDYVAKPFTLEALERAVGAAVGATVRLRSATAPRSDSPSPTQL